MYNVATIMKWLETSMSTLLLLCGACPYVLFIALMKAAHSTA
jgi:hypothetical protein